ncbi:Phosphoribosyltransferase domain [Trypanosoma melophagium]|uniref:Phosphoribosyltransferase domain n=1 Tax=Trypanosoma melophagium TaxID=715481 RepID=UPI00351A08F9|nr:Phosphoribosyltransferase domain [Trypanosoma melophagium]
MSRHYDFASQTLFTQEELHTRIRSVAARIAADYKDKDLRYLDNPLVLVCVLKGSFIFAADLSRALGDAGVPVRVEFICVASYGSGVSSSGQVRLLLDTRHSVEHRHVLLVEDIVDSALTLQYLHAHYAARRPATLRTVVLLDKPTGRRLSFTPDYVVATVPNAFVVGYGLDYDESYREVRDVVVLDPKIYAHRLRQKAKTTEAKSKL